MQLATFCKTIRVCRFCGHPDLTEVIDFGEPYISDFLIEGAAGVRAPLLIVRCQRCGLVQMGHDINPALLFEGRYWYRSGVNQSMVEALSAVAKHVEERLPPGEVSVLDIGANDGTLLRAYSSRMKIKYAVEPSSSFWPELIGKGLHCVPGMWPACSRLLPRFHAITSVACFYQSQTPGEFVAAIREHLAPGGFWVLQIQCERGVCASGAFDYFCHEHTCLWDTATLAPLLADNGLEITETRQVHVNGLSTRYTIRARNRSDPASARQSEADLAAGNEEWRVFTDSLKIRCARVQAMNLHKRVYLGVGASTKANTSLQFYGLTQREIRAIIDIDPEKRDRYMVGSQIPIVSEADGEAFDAVAYIPLAWQHLEVLRARAPHKPFLMIVPDIRWYRPLHRRPLALAAMV